MSVGLLGEGGTFLWRCRLFVRIVLSACVGGKLVIRKCDMCRSLHRVLSSFVCHAFRANMFCFSIFCDFFLCGGSLVVCFFFICFRNLLEDTRIEDLLRYTSLPETARLQFWTASLRLWCQRQAIRHSTKSEHRVYLWRSHDAALHPFPTHRKLILKKTKVTTINKLATANSARAALFSVSETHLRFQCRYRPTSFQVAQGFHRFTQTVGSPWCQLFRSTSNGPRPAHSGSQGRSQLSVQRADWTSGQCHFHCHLPEACFVCSCDALLRLRHWTKWLKWTSRWSCSPQWQKACRSSATWL